MTSDESERIRRELRGQKWSIVRAQRRIQLLEESLEESRQPKRRTPARLRRREPESLPLFLVERRTGT